MKYTSLIDNIKSLEWSLSIQEAYLFSWVYSLPSWADKVIIGTDVFYFGSKTKAIDDCPLLTDKTDTIYRYYKSLEQKGLILIKKIDGKDYLALTEKSKEWGNKSEQSEKNPRVVGIKSEKRSEKNPTYNIINTIKELGDNNTNGSAEPVDIDFIKLKEYWNNKAVRVSKILSIDAVREKSIKSLVKKHGKVIFFTALKNMLESEFHNLDLSQSWKGNFDWILKPANFKKMLELDNSVEKKSEKIDKSKWVFG